MERARSGRAIRESQSEGGRESVLYSFPGSASTIPAEQGRRWTVESFAGFWKKPDASRVSGVLTEDVVGHWPRPIGVVRGAPAYVNGITTILQVCPDFTVTVAEHAATGDSGLPPERHRKGVSSSPAWTVCRRAMDAFARTASTATRRNNRE